MAKVEDSLFRLRVELSDEVAQFSFMYFEGNYKILTYAFIPKNSTHDKAIQSYVKWQEVSQDKALPIIELGMQKYREMMTAFDKEPNF